MSSSSQTRRRRAGSFVPSLPTTHEMPPSQVRPSQRTSLLAANYDPIDALHQYLSVSRVAVASGVPPFPNTVTMPIVCNGHLPTHALALYETSSDRPSQCYILPIDSRLYSRGFYTDILSQASTGSIPPSRSSDGTITLPLVPYPVPHLPSAALLLLFGMGLETQINTMAWRLLPPHVIEEFPNAAAMSQMMVRLGEEDFFSYLAYNQGIWKNVLALGPQDKQLVEMVKTVWNVTADAHRKRQRSQR
ncbi:hypothetical protein EYR36_001379 [Pleurotus pulmonarius]|nr:hypothetical protein EYR36_001379 [Pleurotus pulmonarius]